ncbi:MAG: hypothetical protein JHC95_21465 [Solirubrobacteraceae bacterium]|nr:hypothetical protein [Solirubrobacteraceae bacterium]
MPVDPRRVHVHAHITAVGRRDEDEAGRLMAALVRGCWPGGVADRTVPAARSWVRAWGPEVPQLAAPGCECEFGACVVCN